MIDSDWLGKRLPKEPLPVELNGGRGLTTSERPANEAIYHDIIRFFPKNKDTIFKVCFPLYSQGCSLREIARQTGFAKSSIRTALNSHGLSLRPANQSHSKTWSKPVAMRSGIVPYGYTYLEGQLTVDPREYKVILQCVRQWQSGRSFTAIAQALNDKNVPTRMGRRWTHSVVATLIKRHLESQKNQEEK